MPLFVYHSALFLNVCMSIIKCSIWPFFKWILSISLLGSSLSCFQLYWSLLQMSLVRWVLLYSSDHSCKMTCNNLVSRSSILCDTPAESQFNVFSNQRYTKLPHSDMLFITLILIHDSILEHDLDDMALVSELFIKVSGYIYTWQVNKGVLHIIPYMVLKLTWQKLDLDCWIIHARCLAVVCNIVPFIPARFLVVIDIGGIHGSITVVHGDTRGQLILGITMLESILGYDIVQIVGGIYLDGNVARRISLFEDSLD